MYEIRITKKEFKEVPRGGEWTVIEKRPYTQEELKEYNPLAQKEYANGIKEVRGYTPDRVVQEEVTRDILRQDVEELDVPAVIKAINKL